MPAVAICILACILLLTCFTSIQGQRFDDFTIVRPVPAGHYLVIGFLGGREPWDNDKQGVRQLALKIRSEALPIQVETVENAKRNLALKLIETSFDTNLNGSLDPYEKAQVRLILYGQSFGGAAVVKLSRQLQRLEIPVELTIQIDSVGRNDALIPDNVKHAANLFQADGWIIKGEPQIRAENPDRTRIIGNFQFKYRKKNIDLSDLGIWKTIFRKAHAKMGRDSDVWAKVEELIRTAVDPE